jgi:hypothetical protein
MLINGLVMVHFAFILGLCLGYEFHVILQESRGFVTPKGKVESINYTCCV